MRIIILDITQEHCPMTFVRTKIELSKLRKGDLLEVLVTDGEPLDSIPKTSAQQGYTVIEITPVENHIHKIVIRK